jgi:dsRNA-specific ribonuclease
MADISAREFGYKGVPMVPEYRKRQVTKKKKDPRDLLKYLDGFFGVRNNIKGDPKEGVNFTIETLTYMTSHNRADQITKMIVDRMHKLGHKDPFGVFECCAGIGGNTLSFLDNPNVQWVVSYELRPERREMLKRNVAMYNLSGKAFVQDKPFTGVPDKYKGVVLYMDPPWLPEHIKGHESTKEDYILHGIKVGDRTLEQWIESCKNCAMVVMRVPPGYRMDPIPGVKYDTVLLKNSLVYFATPEQPILKPIAPITTATVVTKKVDIKPVIEPSEQQWREGLKRYLRDDLLKILLPSESHRAQMVSDEAMKVWVPCFTHESYDPNPGHNYEELEFLGDHSMEFSFVKYLYKTIPNITRSEMSDLKSKYISKAFQGQVGWKLGLNKWVRIRVENNIHVSEDLLEAFFGGLDTVGDMVFKFGAGAGLSYNMIVIMFKDITIDRKLGKKAKNPKTQVKELFEKLHWGVAKETVQEGPNNTVTGTVSFTPEAIEDLRKLGVNITTPILAVETARTKKMAFTNAYPVVLENLTKIGITEDWVEKFKGDKDLNNPTLIPYVQAVQERSQREGYERFYLKKVQTTPDGVYVHP